METLQLQISELIRLRRRALSIKQDRLSEISGVALRTIRDLEKGVGNPSLQTLTKVLDVLGMELSVKNKPA